MSAHKHHHIGFVRGALLRLARGVPREEQIIVKAGEQEYALVERLLRGLREVNMSMFLLGEARGEEKEKQASGKSVWEHPPAASYALPRTPSMQSAREVAAHAQDTMDLRHTRPISVPLTTMIEWEKRRKQEGKA